MASRHPPPFDCEDEISVSGDEHSPLVVMVPLCVGSRISRSDR
jgi:hypothetical protein